MDKVGAYKILSDKQLVIEYYSGEINVDDLIHLKNIISKESNYNFFTNTVFDVRNADLMFSKSDLLKLNDFLSKKFIGSGARTIAFLTNKPNDVVQTTLFSHLVESSELNYNSGIFSTIDGIVNWLCNPEINKKPIETTLFELKTKPNNVYFK